MKARIEDADSLRSYVIRRLQKKVHNLPSLRCELRELSNIVEYYANNTKEGVVGDC